MLAATQRLAQENRDEEDRIASETMERLLVQIDERRRNVSERISSQAEAIQLEKLQAEQAWVRDT